MKAPHDRLDNQANAVPLRRSAPSCTFCDHEISRECDEMGPGGSNLPNVKKS